MPQDTMTVFETDFILISEVSLEFNLVLQFRKALESTPM